MHHNILNTQIFKHTHTHTQSVIFLPITRLDCWNRTKFMSVVACLPTGESETAREDQRGVISSLDWSVHVCLWILNLTAALCHLFSSESDHWTLVEIRRDNSHTNTWVSIFISISDTCLAVCQAKVWFSSGRGVSFCLVFHKCYYYIFSLFYTSAEIRAWKSASFPGRLLVSNLNSEHKCTFWFRQERTTSDTPVLYHLTWFKAAGGWLKIMSSPPPTRSLKNKWM